MPELADIEVHESLMRLALEQSKKARLSAPPNPWVGAIVVSDAGIYYGHTESPGGRHAEVVALQSAGDAARGATIYVTLEPCVHYGRTPPCVEAIVAAGIKKVVFGLTDPDSRVNGLGADYLRLHGVEVIEEVLSGEIKQYLAPYLKQRKTGLPWVVLKLATTLDGRIAASDGSSNWITGQEARKNVHFRRAQSEVIVVGANTVRVDNPHLDVRNIEGARSPRRIVMGSISEESNVLPAEEFYGSPSELVRQLGADGVLSVLVEGGAHLAKSFYDFGLIDEFVFYIAPAIHGGADGVSAFAGQGAVSVDDITRLVHKSVSRVGIDVEIVAWSKSASDLIDSL